MKIGILTFHRAHNYGAMLQAYALHKVLSNLGHYVEFISYRQPKIENAYKSFPWKYEKAKGVTSNIKDLISCLIAYPRRERRRKAFCCFSKNYLPESSKYSKEQMLSQYFDYDAVFFGSDQIWTTRFMGSFDDVFWGDIHLVNGEKIAYAPSMELTSLTISEEEYIKRHIVNFDSISARETNMSELLEAITKRHIPTVLDPTLLCSKDDYRLLIEKSNHTPSQPYVLVYQVGHFPQVSRIAQEVAKFLNCNIIEIGSEVLLHRPSTYRDNSCPSDFVALIANAKFIVSCSFHGTAFSVIFQKPFYSVLISGLDSRVRSFLSQVDLMQCGISSIDEIDMGRAMNVDYVSVSEKLRELRVKSLSYITQSLNYNNGQYNNTNLQL